MAVTKYSYTKEINNARLKKEILESAITIALDHLDANGAALDVYFKDALPDQTLLDTLITNHVNTALSEGDEPTDSDNSKIFRVKAAKSGRTYHKHNIQFITAKQGSLVETDYLGAALGHSSIAFFKYSVDMNGDKTGAIESCMESMADFTQIDFSPDYDYEVIGGEVRIAVGPNDDTYLWVIAVPDIPAPAGSKVMIENANLKFFGPGDPVKADGKTVKNLSYVVPNIPDGWGNKLRFYIQHHQSINIEMQCTIELFKD